VTSRDRIYRQISPAARQYARRRGWDVHGMTLAAIDGRLVISYQTRDAIGWRWHHIGLAVIDRHHAGASID
jgi:hypothetical protein